MGLLAEESFIAERFAVGSGSAGVFAKLDANPEATTANINNVVRRDAPQPLDGICSECCRVFRESFVYQHIERRARDSGAEGVPPVGGPVGSRRKHVHYAVVSEHRRNGVEPARESLPDDDHIRADPFVLKGEHLAGAPQSGLDLITHEEHVFVGSHSGKLGEVAVRGNDDPRFPLDWLNEDGAGVRGDRAAHRISVTVRQHGEPRGEGAKPIAIGGFRGEPDDRGCAAVEVPIEYQDLCLVGRDALLLVAPPPGGLDCGLHGLRASVHRQDARESADPVDSFVHAAELVVVEGA